jgi:integrase/recombinase XerD
VTELRAPWYATYRTGFFIAKSAEGISKETVLDYTRSLGYFEEWLGDRDVPSASDLKAFFAWLRERPCGLGTGRKLSPKTVYNAWVALKSFFRWYGQETAADNPMTRVPAPKVPETVIEPLTQEQIASIVRSCDYAKSTQRPGQRAFVRRRPTASRDRAIVLVLLDAGLRASELCALRVDDLDLDIGKLLVRKGKGGKGRIVYVGRATRRALWRYLSKRKSGASDPLFITSDGRPFDRDRLRHLLDNLGDRSGVASLHPHRLRHTFATEFLRNGGNLLGLQRLLGHSSLEMVRRYAAIAESDLARAHETGSPADKWHL